MLHTQPINRLYRERGGFTMVEVAIVVVIVGLIFPLFAFILSMYHDAYYLDEKVRMSNETSQALWYMEDGVRVSNGFLTAVPSQYVDPYGPHDLGTSGGEAWSYKGDSSASRVLITQNYATTTNALSTGRQPVFENTPTFNCTTQMYYQPQLEYTSIYFVKNRTLYYRLITDKTTALCAGNAQQQKLTCPPYIISSRNASCETNDEVLATNVSNFSVAYYHIVQDGTSTQLDPTYTSTDPTILSTADYVEVTITQSVRNNAISISLKQRMTKVNQ
ncbi:MAG: prepilin-type N-terminal cleavage/methylation domain-containing protein [Candidatus Saccharimonadaceae bacterium]